MERSASELIDEIGTRVKGIWSHSENPELLSKDLNDIAVLNWGLAKWRTEFDENERQMKAELELDKANGMLRHTNSGEAVNKAEIRMTIELGAKKLEYNKMASNLDKVKTMMNANASVMDAARSRLSLIKAEMQS